MKVKLSAIAVSAFAIAGCNWLEDDEIPAIPQVPGSDVTVSADFSQGADGWTHGISDLPPGSEEDYEFDAEVKAIPSDTNINAYYIASHNRSDDVFMFLKKKIDDLLPNTDYTMTGSVTFLSNAGIGCAGIGGSPGESVFMKVGGNEIEPVQADYYLNLDIGNQEQGGNDAVVVGDAASEHAVCGDETTFGEKTVTLSSDADFTFTSSSEGEAWVFLGSDSGYEGLSKFYYTDIELALTRQ